MVATVERRSETAGSTSITVSRASNDRRTYNVEEAAKVLGISRSLAYDEARRGTLPGLIRIGNRLLVSKDAIDRLLAGEAA